MMRVVDVLAGARSGKPLTIFLMASASHRPACVAVTARADARRARDSNGLRFLHKTFPHRCQQLKRRQRRSARRNGRV